jgi:hypothetical protein
MLTPVKETRRRTAAKPPASPSAAELQAYAGGSVVRLVGLYSDGSEEPSPRGGE